MASITDCFHFLLLPPVKAWLKEHLDHLLLYGERVSELKADIQNLKNARDATQHKFDEEVNRYDRGIPQDVENWIGAVDTIIVEYENFDNDEDHQLAVFDFFTSGHLPKIEIRYRRSRKAFDIASNVNKLLQTAKHDTHSYRLGPPSMGALFHTVGYESFPSREETMKKIKEELKSPKVRMIGLHGLSGVGKTTLVKEIAREASEASEAAKVFDVVVMANVTRNPDIRKIQGQIADMLMMTLGEESDIARAARIRKRLANEKESTLIILDDLWASLDFNMLGIPLSSDGDDKEHSRTKTTKETPSGNVKGKIPGEHSTTKQEKNTKSRKLSNAPSSVKTEETLSHYKGCKVLLISESKQVLLRQMEGKENPIYFVDVLKEKEAEALFKKMAGIGDRNSEFDKLAAQIINRCNGLPMSIVTIARALKSESRSIWEDALRKLEWKKLSGAPELSTRLSYDLLENEELKYAFLLCARMGPDALIMDLVKYCIGLGFLQGIYTVREAKSRVHALVGKLKVSGLLSDSYSSDHFTMSDTVRSAALSISSEEKQQIFTMTKRKIDEWPDKLERYAAISLHHCHIIVGFPRRIVYSRLRVFHLNNNDPHLEIPKNFFKGMKELRVLILTGITMSHLDSSIASLTELRMLSLEQCLLDKELSIIGKLEKLRILSFSGSDIEKLPVELKQLKMLQIFDISNCSKLKEIPSNVISSLISLEELYMRNTFIQWEDKEQTHQSKNASLSELRHLNQLTTLDIQIPNAAHLPRNLFFDKLYSYNIVIGDLNARSEIDFKMPEKHEASRFLAIQLKDGFNIHSQKGIKMLFEGVEHLFLDDLKGVNDIFYGLNLKGFPYLKHLLVVNNSNIQSLIDPHPKERRHGETAFPKMESLYLHNLKNLTKICSCKLLEPSFGKLKVIKINLCGKLKNVFSINVLSLLRVLETIEVSECHALKEIIEVETQSNTSETEVKFPELRTLKLQSLSEKFIGFYPISSTDLFDGKVVVSKLERMELSSIQIDKIWSDQPSMIPCFQNLIHLDVNGCWNLKYLISFSMANNLVNLQSLFVSECEKMTNIFLPEQGNHNTPIISQGSIFPNLKNIKVSSMKSLMEIWNSEIPPNSFDKLDTLIIEKCDNDKFVNIFPFYKEGMFQSLCNLRVTNCKSVKVVFDFELDDKKQNNGDVTNLQDVYLETLPKLEHVWKRSRDGILDLKSLQKMWVHECDSLENIFPVSVARRLPNLEYLVIWDCLGLREIVAKGEGHNNDTSNPDPSFDFPKLTSIKFLELPKLSCFYPGPESYRLSCPALNDLSIELCDRLDPFRKDTTALFSEEVINKLKSMQIESWHAKSSSSYIGEGNHRRDNLEELCLSGLVDPEILYSFLHRNPNLKSLSLNDCFFTDIVPLEMPSEIKNLGVVPKLKSLKLIDLLDLETIGFERDIILERIESLILSNCPRLVNIIPSSVSLTHLTSLEVVNCGGLVNLMPISAAKSLVQLNSMKVIKCESMVEIVETEEENAAEVDIIFRQLKVVELVTLKNLNCFSKSCVVEFPLLEKLVVSACSKMEKFSKEVKSSSLLQKIYVVPENEKRWCWEDNINDTIRYIFKEKIFFEGMDEITVSEHPELLETLYQSSNLSLQKNWFCSLTTLKLENCEIKSFAIPSNILPCLNSLKELEVNCCHNIEGIFYFNDAEIMGTRPPYQNLQQVSVGDCKNLKSLFHVAMAENVACPSLQGIVGRDAAGKEVTKKFEFPNLNYLYLTDLPKLTHFYPGTFTLKCPALIDLAVTGCSELDLFQSAHLEGESEGSSSTSINEQQPLFLDQTAISNLEELELDLKGASSALLWFGKFKKKFMHLNNLSLILEDWDDDDDDDDNNKQLRSPIEILEMAPLVKEMEINSCSNPESLFSQNPRMDKEGMLGRLESLSLFECPGSKALVQDASAVSFSNLKQLHVISCDELNYLFTSSVVKELKCLEEIEVEDCRKMKQVVERGDTSEGVKFERLEFIHLDSMESLQCFYSGSNTLQLPSLIQVDIHFCDKMEIFSKGPIEAKSISGIRVDDEMLLCDDLNVSMGRLQVEQDYRLVVDGGSPLLESIWLGSMPALNPLLADLKSLTVEGCDFLSNAIIPSHLLRSLSNLEELQVRKCNSVKAIFDQTEVNGTESASEPLSIHLKKLILEELPILEHVWNEDPQGSLSLPFLEEVKVDGCKSIISLFPAASVTTDGLQILHVKNCERLVKIVAKDDVSAEEANQELFPILTSLRLWNLPNLSCIYPGMHVLNWPKLRKLYILNCQMLKIFATEFQNSPESHLEEQNSFLTNRQACVSLEKVTPRLEVLSLGKEEAKMIEQGKLHVDLQELDTLVLQCFHDESDVFPFVFSSKARLPTMAKLVVRHSAFKEIFPSQSSDTGCTILSQLEELELRSLTLLKSIGLDHHSWVGPFVENLQTLLVWNCGGLRNLTPSVVSFYNLIKINVKNCRGLTYLFTSSTAKTLCVLRELRIANCKSLKAIVAKEGDEYQYEDEDEDRVKDDDESEGEDKIEDEDERASEGEDEDEGEGESKDEVESEGEVEDKGEDEEEDEYERASEGEGEGGDEDEDEDEYEGASEGEDEYGIIFQQLEILKLSSLPKLVSFYTGSSTLKFPTLERLSFNQCHNTKVFRLGDEVPKDLQVTIDGECPEDDINSVIMQELEEGRQPADFVP